MVIFDNDGVLIDSEKLAARSNAELLTSLGYPTTAEDCEARFTGISDRPCSRNCLIRGYTLPKDFIQQMYAVSEHAFETELEADLWGARGYRKSDLSACQSCRRLERAARERAKEFADHRLRRPADAQTFAFPAWTFQTPSPPQTCINTYSPTSNSRLKRRW